MGWSAAGNIFAGMKQINAIVAPVPHLVLFMVLQRQPNPESGRRAVKQNTSPLGQNVRANDFKMRNQGEGYEYQDRLVTNQELQGNTLLGSLLAFVFRAGGCCGSIAAKFSQF